MPDRWTHGISGVFVLAYAIQRVGDIEARQVPDPVPGGDEVLLRTNCVSLCSTDVAYFRGALTPAAWPIVPGHEYVGEVVAVGADVAGIRPGDRLTYWGQTDFGGMAEYRAIRPLLAGARPPDPGQFTHRDFTDSDFAAAAILPPHVSDDVATLTEPLTSVLRALLPGPPKPGDRVLVLGGGPSALLAVFALRHIFAAGEVAVVDLNPCRLGLARQVGASVCLDPVADRERIAEMVDSSGGDRCDYVFDALPDVRVGSVAGDIRATAMRLLRPEGDYVVYGATELPQEILTWIVLAKALRIRGVGFDVRAFPMWRTAHVLDVAVHLLSRHLDVLAPVVTAVVRSDDVDAVRRAFATYGAGGALKTVIDYRRAPAPSPAPLRLARSV